MKETFQRHDRDPASETTAKPSAVELGGVRGGIFRRLQDGDLDGFQEDLLRYAAMLRQLVESALGDLSELSRLESDHRIFFEQLKATLVTNRIQLRMELGRVKASRRYGRDGAVPVRAGWEG
jgi:hypothetical protein